LLARREHFLVGDADVIATALEALDHLRMIHECGNHGVLRTVLLDGAYLLELRQPTVVTLPLPFNPG
jgi:hypothetical protein